MPDRSPRVRAVEIEATGRVATVAVNGVALGVERFGDATAPLVLLAGATERGPLPQAASMPTCPTTTRRR